MSKNTCGSSPSFCARTNAFAGHDHCRSEDHVVADLRRLTGAELRRRGSRLSPWARGTASLARTARLSRRPSVPACPLQQRRSRRKPGRRRSRSPWRSLPRRLSRALATSMVEQSISRRASFALGATSFSNTARTCFAAGSMVMTTSASLTACLADPAAEQPPAAAFSTASGTRSNARTSWPALARFGAIPPPM